MVTTTMATPTPFGQNDDFGGSPRGLHATRTAPSINTHAAIRQISNLMSSLFPATTTSGSHLGNRARSEDRRVRVTHSARAQNCLGRTRPVTIDAQLMSDGFETSLAFIILMAAEPPVRHQARMALSIIPDAVRFGRQRRRSWARRAARRNLN